MQKSVIIGSHILSQVEKTLSTYHLLDRAMPVLVAFSGGKDSLLSALILRDLGFTVIPVYVEMGFKPQGDQPVAELAKQFGLHVSTVDIRKKRSVRAMSSEAQNRIADQLQILDHYSILANQQFTPCTYCYNVKNIVLHNLAALFHIKQIVLGHHATDAMVSLLKSALMYIDRWDREHILFERDHFIDLVCEFEDEMMRDEEGALFKRVNELVQNGLAGTDEPPKKMVADMEGIQIIRPLFDLSELDIKKESERLKIHPVPDGCELTVKPILTSRELIHRAVSLDKVAHNKLVQLKNLVDSSLNEDGTIRYDVRLNRSEILGSYYKSCPLNVKL